MVPGTPRFWICRLWLARRSTVIEQVADQPECIDPVVMLRCGESQQFRFELSAPRGRTRDIEPRRRHAASDRLRCTLLSWRDGNCRREVQAPLPCAASENLEESPAPNSTPAWLARTPSLEFLFRNGRSRRIARTRLARRLQGWQGRRGDPCSLGARSRHDGQREALMSQWLRFLSGEEQTVEIVRLAAPNYTP